MIPRGVAVARLVDRTLRRYPGYTLTTLLAEDARIFGLAEAANTT